MRTNPYQAPQADLDDEPRGRQASAEIEGLGEILVPLKLTRPWVKLIAVAGFIAAALLVLLGVIALFADLKMSALMAFVYLLAGAVYIVPSLHLSRYAASIQELLRTRETSTLVRALDHQRKFWHFSGVLTLLVLALYGVGFFVIVVMALSKPHL